MRYKVGDKVRVMRDLETAVMYGVLCATYEMLKEKIVTIKSVHDGYYKVVEDDYKWTDEMFEGLAEELTAEEAIKILGEICCGNELCGGCPIGEAKGKRTCQSFQRDKTEGVLVTARNDGNQYLIGKYFTEEKAIKAMEMCREKYQGFFTKGNCMLDHPKVFRFPADDEI